MLGHTTATVVVWLSEQVWMLVLPRDHYTQLCKIYINQLLDGNLSFESLGTP